MQNTTPCRIDSKSFRYHPQNQSKAQRRRGAATIWRLPILLLATTILSNPLAAAEPTVHNNVISLPDDGWYEIQTADGALSLCSGVRSCTMQAGHYLVINHTLGIRYPDVIVEPWVSPNEVQVTELRISWPDDGWYQVQTNDGSTTICNGGQYCDVEPGVYMLINHTTGIRINDIQVSDDTDVVDEVPSTDDIAVINQSNHAALLTQAFSVYTGNIYGDTLPGEGDDFRESHSSSDLEVADEDLEQYDYASLVRYSCDNDGSMDFLTAGGYGRSVRRLVWQECLDGDINRSGLIFSYDNGGYGSYYRPPLSSTSYSADYTDGKRVEMSGDYGTLFETFISPSITRRKNWFTDEFDYRLQGGSADLEVNNATTELEYTWYRNTDNAFQARFKGSFQLNSTLTDQHDLEVNTSAPFFSAFQGDIVLNSSPLGYYPDWTPDGGVLEMSADDGSALRLTADNGDPRTADITLLQDGFELETFQQPWSIWWDALIRVKGDPRRLQGQ